MIKKKSSYKKFTSYLGLGAAALMLAITLNVLVMVYPGSSDAEESKPAASVTVFPLVAEYKPNVEVIISGAGYQPNQQLRLRIFLGGVVSDISYMVKPKPVANELGAFLSVWKLKREIGKKMLEPLPSVYTLAVVDEESRKTLATAPLAFCDPSAEKKSPACNLVGKP